MNSTKVDRQDREQQAISAQVESLTRRIHELESILQAEKGQQSPSSTELRYRTLVEDLPVLICRFLADGSLTFANGNFCQHFGRSFEDLVGQSYYQFISEDQREDVRARYVCLTEENPVVTYEHPIVTPGGEPRWHRWTGRAFFDDQGQPVEYQSIGQDMTDRRQLDETLRESEAKFRLLFSAAQDALVLVDSETRQILDANDAVVRLYGYDRESLLKMNALELSADPDLSKKFIAQTLSSARSQLALNINLHKRKDGSTFPVEITSGVIHLRSKKMIYAMFRDITSRVQAETELRESRERFRQLAEHIDEVFWLFDWKAQKVLFVSPAYETVWGRAIEDLYQNYAEWGESIHPEDLAHAQETFERITLTGGGEAREYRIVRPDGSVRWIADRGFLITDEDGQILRIAGLANDITDRKKQEKEREELIGELEAKNAELERFTYTVSHDLKSPLITIRGFLDYLEKDAQEGNLDRMRADLGRIADAADRMEQLLDELLELSRLGRTVFPSEAFSLFELAGDVLNVLAKRLAARNVEVKLDPHLPVVFGDRVRLCEVFENLIDNALKNFGEQPDPCLEIGLRTGADELAIFVRDNGIGIEPRYHTKVFELFEQLDPSKPGTGIGLAIVKRIIELHGGRIWVESEGTGCGATICFTLPDRRRAPGNFEVKE